MYKNLFTGGTWVAQSVKCPTLAQVMISQFVGSSPTLTAQSLEPASILCLPLSLPLACSHSVSLSLKNKHKKMFKKYLKKRRDLRGLIIWLYKVPRGAELKVFRIRS